MSEASSNPEPPRRQRWLRRLLAIAVMGGLLWVFHVRLLEAAARFLDVSEPPRSVDAIVVLGGGVDTRPFAAAALIRFRGEPAAVLECAA